MMAAVIVACIAVVVSIIGWFVVYRLNTKAQREYLFYQILNETRIIITGSIREYQEWLMNVVSVLENFHKYMGPSLWPQHGERIIRLFFEDARASKWMERLEEHLALLPEVSRCGVELIDRQHEISKFLKDLIDRIGQGETERVVAICEGQAKQMFLRNQLFLVNQLLLYIRNYCLSAISKQASAALLESTEAGPYLGKDADGNLHIINQDRIDDYRSILFPSSE
jgi:hypothetical protein